MAKNKRLKFSQISDYSNVVEPTFNELQSFPLKSHWNQAHFKNDQPVVLELGCGKGEYTVRLAQEYPQKNFIGIDIKGARMWKGATDALSQNLSNVAFLRTRIEFIEHCFGANEIDEIWITFPDPQIKKRRAKNRLTHPVFLKRYSSIIKKDGLIHLKTDSQFLHGYTLGIIQGESHILEDAEHDIYGAQLKRPHTDIKTYYESQFLQQGRPITYLCFRLNY